MKLECIEFKRCCFCLPLRYGLLVTAYLAVAFSLMAVSVLVKELVYMINVYQDGRNSTKYYILITIALLFNLLCGALNIVFIVGGHKKNARLMSVYYYYAIVILVLLLLRFVLSIGFYIYHFYFTISNGMSNINSVHIMQEGFLMDLAVICFQAYMVFLTRSEIKKLKNNHTYRFVNNATEGECSIVKEIYEGTLVTAEPVVEDVRKNESEEKNAQEDTLDTVDEVDNTKKKGNYVKLV